MVSMQHPRSSRWQPKQKLRKRNRWSKSPFLDQLVHWTRILTMCVSFVRHGWNQLKLQQLQLQLHQLDLQLMRLHCQVKNHLQQLQLKLPQLQLKFPKQLYLKLPKELHLKFLHQLQLKLWKMGRMCWVNCLRLRLRCRPNQLLEMRFRPNWRLWWIRAVVCLHLLWPQLEMNPNRVPRSIGAHIRMKVWG